MDRKVNLSSALLAEMIEDNLSAKSLSFAALPGGEMHPGNPTWFTSGLERIGYNGVTQAEFSAENIHEQIEATLGPFRAANTPLTWWVGPLSKPGNLGRALQAHGFIHNRDMIGMAAPLEGLPPPGPLPSGYTFGPICDRAGMQTWLHLFMDVFGVPASDAPIVLDVFEQTSFAPASEWRHYALWTESGEVAATSSLHLGAGIAGLYNIATLPTHRQNGLGTAITLLTYALAKDWGYSVGALQTTYPNALRLYHRLGFEVYCKFGVYQNDLKN